MDVVAIVDRLSEYGFVRTKKVSGDWYQCFCPFHGDGKERRPSFGILIHTQHRNGQLYPEGFAHCFACGYAKTFIEFVNDLLKLQHIDKDGLDWLIENIPGFEADQNSDFESLLPQDMVEQMTNKFAIEQIEALQGKEKTTYISEEELQSYRFTVPYMEQRGLTPEIIEMYDVGVDMNFVPPGRKRPVPCITFPVRDREGRTLFLCRRSIEGKMFNYPENVVKPLYGIDMIPPGCKSLILTESCINTLTCVKWGYSAVGLLGTGNLYQLQQLKELGVSSFVLGFDGDDAGQKAINRWKKQLSSVAMIYVMKLPPGKDINDLTQEEFEKIYANRE